MTITDHRTADEQAAAADFATDTTNHTMEVLFQQGVYRHLRFTAPGSFAWFDIHTWPKSVVIDGAHGSYHFRVLDRNDDDLFALFRESADGGSINAGYWAEKARAGQVKSWSETKFRTWLQDLAARIDARCPGLAQAVTEEILDSDHHNLEHESVAREALGVFSHNGVRISYPEEWQVSFQDFDHHYLWSCHAIVWGIAQYDAAVEEQVEHPEASGR